MIRKTFGFMIVMLLAATVALAQETAPRVLMHRSEVPPSFVPTDNAAPTLTVPASTEADVELLSGIHTRISSVDDPIRAMLVNPVFVDGRIALPSGTLLDGRITQVRAARRFHRPGELSFRFEQVTLPDGETEPLSAVLERLETPLAKLRIDSEGHLKGTRGFSWKALTGGFGALGAFAGVKYAIAGAGALTTVLPATGSALLGFEMLWPRGNDVHVPPDTRCRVRLNYPLTVRVAW
ncbi:MAG TPA: hypothetical protein VG204_14930 [Terriglobia bacterium]|nr:hypothetical protein [Terriglobia bacterium]